MKKCFFVIGCCWLVAGSYGQDVSQRLKKAYQLFEADSQLKHAVSSLYVIDANTGVVVFDKNAQVGLAPASTQKIITSVTAFELLGKTYRYKTELGYTGKLNKGIVDGSLYVIGTGDPTLGSPRWQTTKDSVILKKWLQEIKKKGIKRINGNVVTNFSKFSYQSIPDGWIWQDIGNYYGAASYALNWKENQYDMKLASGNSIGDPVQIINDSLLYDRYMNYLKSAPIGTGDNAYIYWDGLVNGTIPIKEKSFSISGASKDPIKDLLFELSFYLSRNSIPNEPRHPGYDRETFSDLDSGDLKKVTIFYTHYSPSLDSIIYWFNKRSINLYGEALVKTFAYEKQGFGSTDSGVAIVKRFWKEKGLDEDELNIYDGSGLSPLNRVTTHAQVEILKYAKSKDWYPYFYDALPEYNAMKMKSGTISDVKGFCGYHQSKDGKEYIFSFLVNNYSGKSADLVSKMYKVLNELK